MERADDLLESTDVRLHFAEHVVALAVEADVHRTSPSGDRRFEGEAPRRVADSD
jgi:hypothetical protein